MKPNVFVEVDTDDVPGRVPGGDRGWLIFALGEGSSEMPAFFPLTRPPLFHPSPLFAFSRIPCLPGGFFSAATEHMGFMTLALSS